MKEFSVIVYHGTDYNVLIDSSLDPRSYVTTDKWCAESYGTNIFIFECKMADLEPDFFGLPPGVNTNIFRIRKRMYPIKPNA